MKKEKEETVVACTLPEPQARARRTEIATGLMKKVVEIEELDEGYALCFEASPGIAEELGRFIEIERACCAFMTFALRVQRDGGPVRLELGGSAAAKEFLRSALGRS